MTRTEQLERIVLHALVETSPFSFDDLEQALALSNKSIDMLLNVIYHAEIKGQGLEDVISEVLAHYKDAASEKQYDNKGNAKHYDSRINALTQMELIWGTKAAMHFCEITEFKYRLRMGKKEGQPLEQELIKANWYSKAAKYLSDKMVQGGEIQPAPEGNPLEKI